MKKYSLGIITFVFAIATAYTTKPVFSTFQFNGTSTIAAHRVSPAQYSLASPGCPGAETVLCSIDAVDNGGSPVIGTAGNTLYNNLYNGGAAIPNFTPTDIKGYKP